MKLKQLQSFHEFLKAPGIFRVWPIVLLFIATSQDLYGTTDGAPHSLQQAGLVGSVQSVVSERTIFDQSSPTTTWAWFFDESGIMIRVKFNVVGKDGSVIVKTEKYRVITREVDREEEKWLDENKSLIEKTVRRYDSQHRPVESIEYGLNGLLATRESIHYTKNRKEAVFHASDGSVLFKNVFVFDQTGNVIELMAYKQDRTVGERTVFTYNESGKRTETISYDTMSSVTERTTYVYDAKGNETGKIIYGPNDSLRQKELSFYEYDSTGNWTRSVTRKWVTEGGALVQAPEEVTKRVISYFANSSKQ